MNGNGFGKSTDEDEFKTIVAWKQNVMDYWLIKTAKKMTANLKMNCFISFQLYLTLAGQLTVAQMQGDRSKGLN